MTPSSVLLTATEKVYLGERAGTAIAAEAERLGSERVFLLVSRTLNRETDEIAEWKEEKRVGPGRDPRLSGALPSREASRERRGQVVEAWDRLRLLP